MYINIDVDVDVARRLMRGQDIVGERECLATVLLLEFCEAAILKILSEDDRVDRRVEEKC